MRRVASFIIFGLALWGCSVDNTEPSCFDSLLVHDDACTTDCPGFEGCDGNFYCNACEAARNGIGPK